MIENLRKRNHRIKTVASTITSQPQRTSNYFFENRKESISFRKSINKVDSFFTHQRTGRIYSSFKCSSKMKKSTSRMRPEPVNHKLLTVYVQLVSFIQLESATTNSVFQNCQRKGIVGVEMRESLRLTPILFGVISILLCLQASKKGQLCLEFQVQIK